MVKLFSKSIHRPSSFLRTASLVYIFLIIYASLYPFSGWRFSGASPFFFLFTSLPRYWTQFDVLINVIGYVPLGILLSAAISPLLRGFKAFLFAFVVCLLLSLIMEALQVYLPNRVPSNLDWIMNSTGGFIGAILGTSLTPILFREDRAHYFIQRWIRFGSSRVLIIPMLWPLSLIYPQNYLFGLGDIFPVISEFLSVFWDQPIHLSFQIIGQLQLTPQQYWLSETIITATGLAGAVLTLLCILKRNSPRIFLATLLIIIALVFKSLACALFFEPQNALIWLTPGAIGGMIVGILMLSGLIFTSPLIQRRVAIYMLLTSIMTINILPENQYFLSTLQMWSQGQFLNFNGAAYFLMLIWPFLALCFLFQSIYNLRQSE